MRRILVIKDVGLWISLNRQLAGDPEVQLSEATTLEMGLDLSEVERPDLVVCSGDSTGLAPAALAAAFAERGLERQPLVFVVDDGTAVPTEALAPNFHACDPNVFLDTVRHLLGAEDRNRVGYRVDLLAHMELPVEDSEEPRRGFANLLEIGDREVLLESDESMSLGDEPSLVFFLPARSAGELRSKVALSCRVIRAVDVDRMIYLASFREIGPDSKAHLRQFLDDQSDPGSTRE